MHWTTSFSFIIDFHIKCRSAVLTVLMVMWVSVCSFSNVVMNADEVTIPCVIPVWAKSTERTTGVSHKLVDYKQTVSTQLDDMLAAPQLLCGHHFTALTENTLPWWPAEEKYIHKSYSLRVDGSNIYNMVCIIYVIVN